MFWNLIIRSIIETYLELQVVLLIKTYAINANSWYEVAGSIYAILALTVLTIFSLLVPLFLHCKRDVLSTPDFTSKYGSLVQDLRTNVPASRFYYTLFMLRRQIFTVLIVFVASFPWAQILVT